MSPFEAIAQKIVPHSHLVRHWPLTGGVSAQITALQLQHPNGQSQTLVLRQHGPVDLQRNPHIAAHEFKLLQHLQAAHIAAPKPYYLDQSNELLPTPYLVIEYIDGQSDFAPHDLDSYLYQAARQLAKIHTLTAAADLSFLPQQAQRYAQTFNQPPAQLDDSLHEGQIRAILEPAWPWPSPNPTTLLHGDYWPGNLLWHAGHLQAVIDWEDALLGDPLSDVANARLEILWAFGLEAMHSFTRLYQSLNPLNTDTLPYWDLCAALRPASKLHTWGLDPATEQNMRVAHKAFITQAFEILGLGAG